MLSKDKRLAASEVRQIIKSGRSVRLGALSAKYEEAQSPKYAVVVSKKVASGAVERNALRRLVYNALPPALPRARVVLFVHSQSITPEDVIKICSQLS